MKKENISEKYMKKMENLNYTYLTFSLIHAYFGKKV